MEVDVFEIVTTILIPWAAWITWTVSNHKTAIALNEKDDENVKEMFTQVNTKLDSLTSEFGDVKKAMIKNGLIE